MLRPNNYRAMPGVVSCDKEHTITMKGIRGSLITLPNTEYTLEISATLLGYVRDYPESNNKRIIKVKSDSRGRLIFRTAFEGEQEHFIWVYLGKIYLGRASVFSVSGDLIGRYPFRGDLHLHTKRSDGCFTPAYVAACYRHFGYDFMAITDHGRYYPSLEAIDAYKKVKTELTLVQGEEVHMPFTDLHVVNFGGKYSVNGIWQGSGNFKEKGESKKFRSRGAMDPPRTLSTEEYEKEIAEIESTLTVPEGVYKRSYAVLLWICKHIKNGEGLSIFAHPCWTNHVYQVPELYRDYIMENHPFDAFEVLGGERNFEHNGFQTILYYGDREKGRRYPIVGSTDSHMSRRSNPKALICSTIVFAKENTRENIIDEIKSYHSVAVDTISKEFRLVGDIRLVRYASFLVKNFYPMQKKIAAREGSLMKTYLRLPAVGKSLLARNFGAEARLMKAFFEF